MIEYIRATIHIISSPTNQYTRKKIPLYMKTYKDLISKPKKDDAYGIILKKNIFGVKEILSNQPIFILDIDNEERLKKQLDYINEKLNNGETKLYVTKKAITEYQELVTPKQIEEYIEKASTNRFYNYIRKHIPKKKEEPKQDTKEIKKILKNHKKNSK